MQSWPIYVHVPMCSPPALLSSSATLSLSFVGIICIALFGGKISFESDGHSIKGKAETGGLIDAVLKILDRYKDNKTIGNDKIKEAQRRLEVDDPRKKNKEQD